MPQRGDRWIVSSQVLLAMTADTVSRSRDALRPSSTVGPPSEGEGAGNAGCALHPRSHVHRALKNAHTSIQGNGEHPTFPAQWLYGLWRALPGERLFCLRRALGNRTSPRCMDASVAASGPHVFAVRFSRTSSSDNLGVHRYPSLVVTMANAPLSGTGWARMCR